MSGTNGSTPVGQPSGGWRASTRLGLVALLSLALAGCHCFDDNDNRWNSNGRNGRGGGGGGSTGGGGGTGGEIPEISPVATGSALALVVTLTLLVFESRRVARPTAVEPGA
jgi:hypothetical protein